MNIALVLGTRPEIIKLSPIIHRLKKSNSSIIFSGQHYDYEMGMNFIDELGLRTPDYSFKISHQNSSIQISQIIYNLSKILQKLRPDTVIVQGDTNTVLAGSIAALRSGIPLSHVESGLRSHDWRMPEEHNRIVSDHISDLLFAPTTLTKKNLISEKVHGKIFVTGNTIIDAINMFANKTRKKSEIDFGFENFIITTLHRSENVDNKIILSSIIKAMIDSKENIVFPVHPRTMKKLKEFNLYHKLVGSKNIKILKAIGYFEMLRLMQVCSFIVTDSGGIQEEATSPKIRKKVVVTRDSTDRPEALNTGFAILAGTSYSKILNAIKTTSKNPTPHSRTSPYGAGIASKLILNHIRKNL